MISVNIATQPSRVEQLKKTVESLYNQVDVIRIYCNNFKEMPDLGLYDKIHYIGGSDLTDNGKFYPLKNISQDEYYLTCDDDIIYPPDYVEEMIKLIDFHECIITYHGRI